MFFSRYKRNKVDADKILAKTKEEPPLELEKGDLKAIFIAAMLVLFPILLAFIGALLFIFWLFVGRF